MCVPRGTSLERLAWPGVLILMWPCYGSSVFFFASVFHEFGFSDASCCFLQNLYRSDLNFMRGVPCVIPGSLEIEGRKKASELISEVTGDPGWTGDGSQSVSMAEVPSQHSACFSLLERMRCSA